MLIVRVMGGTGNQMFQYALARKLKEMNKYVVLDISAYKTWEFRYDFCLNRIFDINKDIYITEDPNEFIIKNCRNIKIIDCENQPYYNADILNYDNVYLNGYWMSEKYFKDIEKIQEKVERTTGEKSSIIRFPGGSSNTVSSFNPGIMCTLSNMVIEKGYHYFDWNVSSGDAGSKRSKKTTTDYKRNCSCIFERRSSNRFQKSINRQRTISI